MPVVRANGAQLHYEESGHGDEVVAGGGLIGRITKVSDAYVTVEIAANTEIVVQRQAVQTVLPKGTVKSL